MSTSQQQAQQPAQTDPNQNLQLNQIPNQPHQQNNSQQNQQTDLTDYILFDDKIMEDFQKVLEQKNTHQQQQNSITNPFNTNQNNNRQQQFQPKANIQQNSKNVRFNYQIIFLLFTSRIQKQNTNYKPYVNRYSRSKSRSRSRERLISYQNKKSYKFYPPCCKKCSNAQRNGKTCVCVVPANQRKTNIQNGGCRTCGCTGCSRQDREQTKKSIRGRSPSEKMVNGCCKRCMKAFSKMNKSCLCQVPMRVRKKPLPPHGCDFCGCQGCNPEDKHKNQRRGNNNRTYSNRRRQRSPSYSSSRRSYDQKQLFLSSFLFHFSNQEDMNFYNLNKSSLFSSPFLYSFLKVLAQFYRKFQKYILLQQVLEFLKELQVIFQVSLI